MYGTKPAFALVDQHAVNCIIDTVRANPGQVTIAAIGPCAALHPSADCIQQPLSSGANAHAVDACGRTALMRAADAGKAAIVRILLAAGGDDPLDGISVYDDGHCWHVVGYGLSDLYGRQGDDPDYSGFGVEYTLRLKKAGLDRPDGHVDFVLFIGMTDAELRTLADGRYDVRELYGKYGSDLTDYQRNSVC